MNSNNRLHSPEVRRFFLFHFFKTATENYVRAEKTDFPADCLRRTRIFLINRRFQYIVKTAKCLSISVLHHYILLRAEGTPVEVSQANSNEVPFLFMLVRVLARTGTGWNIRAFVEPKVPYLSVVTGFIGTLRSIDETGASVFINAAIYNVAISRAIVAAVENSLYSFTIDPVSALALQVLENPVPEVIFDEFGWNRSLKDMLSVKAESILLLIYNFDYNQIAKDICYELNPYIRKLTLLMEPLTDRKKILAALKVLKSLNPDLVLHIRFCALCMGEEFCRDLSLLFPDVVRKLVEVADLASSLGIELVLEDSQCCKVWGPVYRMLDEAKKRGYEVIEEQDKDYLCLKRRDKNDIFIELPKEKRRWSWI